MTRQPTRRLAGFTLVELLVVIGIIALLISILLPSLNKAREQAASLKCLSNLKQFGSAIQQYANANKGFLVPGGVQFPVDGGVDRDNWATILVAGKYLPAPPQPPSTTGNTIADTSFGDSVFRCPSGIDQRAGVTTITSPEDQTGAGFFRRLSVTSTTGREGISPGLRVDSWYGINGWGIGTGGTPQNVTDAFARWPFTRIPDPVTSQPQQLHKLSQFRSGGTLALIYDGVDMHSQRLAYVNARHIKRTRTNILFADGHADSVPISDVKNLTETRINATAYLKKYDPGTMRFILRPEPLPGVPQG